MPGALDGLRVIDFGQYLAAPAAAMILADHGADVIRVEPPGGPRWHHHANAILQRGKRSITLDLKTPEGRRTARALVAGADIVLENFRPGVMDRLELGADAMTALNPALIYCSIPGFGRDDPRAGLPGWEGAVSAAAAIYAKGGNKLLKASGQDWPDPIFNPLPLASNYAFKIAVNAILAALIARERTGRGQTIEVPLFDAMFEGFGLFAQALPPGTPNAVIHGAVDNVYRCADGLWIYLSLPVAGLWSRFSTHFMPQSWFDDGFADPANLAADPAMAREAITRMADLFRTRPAAHWDALARQARIPFTICRTTAEWLNDNQAHASGAAIHLDDPVLGPTRQAGFAVTLSGTPAQVRFPRRTVGSDGPAIIEELAQGTAGGGGRPMAGASLQQALEGVRIVDVSHFLAGPTATRILAEFGASVVKVDGPGRPIIGMLQVNSGKRTALVDLKNPLGCDLLWREVEQADVFVQSFAHGVADRLGFGEAAVRARRPDILYASESCFGDIGPEGGRHGVEGVGQTRSGMAMRWGDGSPKLQRFIVCDYGTGHLTAMAILLGLYHRAVTGRGQHVQATLMQSGTYHQLPFAIDYSGRVWDEPAGPAAKGWGPADRLYRAADGWFYLAAPRPEDRQRLWQVAELSGLKGTGDDLLGAAMEEIFATTTVDIWVARLRDAGIAAHPLVDFDALLDSAVARDRGLVLWRDHPGVGPVRATGQVPRLSRTPLRPLRPVGLPGSDTLEIARQSLSDEQVARAVEDGAIASSPVPGTLVWL